MTSHQKLLSRSLIKNIKNYNIIIKCELSCQFIAIKKQITLRKFCCSNHILKKIQQVYNADIYGEVIQIFWHYTPAYNLCSFEEYLSTIQDNKGYFKDVYRIFYLFVNWEKTEIKIECESKQFNNVIGRCKSYAN